MQLIYGQFIQIYCYFMGCSVKETYVDFVVSFSVTEITTHGLGFIRCKISNKFMLHGSEMYIAKLTHEICVRELLSSVLIWKSAYIHKLSIKMSLIFLKYKLLYIVKGFDLV